MNRCPNDWRPTARRILPFVSVGVVSLPIVAQTPADAPARLVITPAVRAMIVGDSLHLRVQALDSRGSAVPGVIVRFNAQGGHFQGTVDSLGWVRGGSPGTVPIAITALVPGGRPVIEKIEVHIAPGPAARVAVTPTVAKLLPSQRLRLSATALSAVGDARDDAIVWSSSNVLVVVVSDDGVLTAIAPGTAASRRRRPRTRTRGRRSNSGSSRRPASRRGSPPTARASARATSSGSRSSSRTPVARRSRG